MKVFVTKLFKFLIPILSLVLFINVFVDSGFLFRKNIKNKKIAKLLVSGKNVGIRQIPAEWGNLQIQIVEEAQKNKKEKGKEILVFGTSRSSEINSELFPYNSFFNCVIPGGSITDIIALYGLYKKNELLPKYLFINIDFCTFHARSPIEINGNIEYIADTTLKIPVRDDLKESFKYAINHLGIKDSLFSYKDTSKLTKFNLNIVSKFRSLFNIDYFQTNLKTSKRPNIIETDQNTLKDYFVIRNDGSYSLAQESMLDSLKTIAKSEEFIRLHKNNFFISQDTTSIYFDYFKKLILKIKQEDIVPIIYISPVNQLIYNEIKSTKDVALEIAVNNFCEKNNIICVGSFNPQKYGYHAISKNFIDAYHPVQSVVFNIFRSHKDEINSIGLDIN